MAYLKRSCRIILHELKIKHWKLHDLHSNALHKTKIWNFSIFSSSWNTFWEYSQLGGGGLTQHLWVLNPSFIGWKGATFPAALSKSYTTYRYIWSPPYFMKLRPTDTLQTKIVALLATWRRFSTQWRCHAIATVISSCIKGMSRWNETTAVFRSKVQFSFLCVLRECGAVDWIVKAG